MFSFENNFRKQAVNANFCSLNMQTTLTFWYRLILSEFEHVQQWAADNKMIINISKTKELVALICLRIDMLCVPGVAF